MSKSFLPQMIILGPGGIKGYLEMGALLYLEKEGYLNEVKTYVGVSIGAVIALLIVAGYSLSEIIEYSFSISLFHDFFSLDLVHIKENSGLISNQQIKTRLKTLLEQKFGFVPTLQELYQFTGLRYIAVTLNIDKTQVEYISYETEPDLSSVEAVMLSMNIPFIFYQIKYKGCRYVDGALGNPYPVDVFDDGKTKILGLYIDYQNKNPENNDLTSYLHHIVHSMTNSLRNLAIHKTSVNCKHLILLTDYSDTLGLSLDSKAKAEMIVKGYEEAKKFYTLN